MEKSQARHIIETLRSGVTSRDVSSVLMVGQGSLLTRCQSDLDEVASGVPRSLVVRGPYGSGKSHFLSAVDSMARQKGFATSRLVVSKETPFNRINKIYEAAAHTVSGPDFSRYGFEDILMSLHPRADKTEDIKSFCEAKLHPKVYQVFRNYLQEGDPFKRSQLYDDLAGTFMPMATLRAIHRANFGEAFRIPRFLVQDTHHYFRFLSFLLRRSGYKGWVIMVDEVELLSKLGIGAQAQAYLNLGMLLEIDQERKIEGLYTVLAMASPFIEEALTGEAPGSRKHDLSEVPAWLRDSRRNRSNDADLASGVMRMLVEESQPLEDLSEADIRDILRLLEELHHEGYEWKGELNQDFVIDRTVSRPVRTTIRAAVEFLDLYYRYDKPPSDITIQELDTGSYEEDEGYPDDPEQTATDENLYL